ncbi:WecB/TagA/CpsF family glycosyltransferase [Carboxylicivirga marina]|uniref:WecB/TagA/CpsF family glycosyltransferase n=1 Tax=Carboxylicivirga marina TaxID=2800988 RepID=A0ABS1HKD6_9BACT|nr:WecB/TagA/CpsF family glycosyltransferase [Carboxylicivirga marina]MBK3518017.1 WecB/TagA/CpsF family glycosyltransferase [Carboxylicivirga marina]
MNNTIDVFGVPVASLTMDETVSYILSKVEERKTLQHVVVNAGKLVAMQKDVLLKNSVLDADLINADGQAVVWASKLLGQPLPERVAGIDLMLNLVQMAHDKGLKCFFLGAKEEVLKKVVDIFSEKYSPDIIGGYRNGYFKEGEEAEIAKDICNSGAHLLFVAISSPKKEIFVNKYKSIMNVPFVMGVGGSFDVVAGITKRAPLWMQKVGLEWFYRFLQEPKRMWKRYLIGNSKFILLVFKEKFKSKK